MMTVSRAWFRRIVEKVYVPYAGLIVAIVSSISEEEL